MINHLTAYLGALGKKDFFPSFLVALQIAITPDKVQGSFRRAGIIPFDFEKANSQLDVRSKTPTPRNGKPGTQQARKR